MNLNHSQKIIWALGFIVGSIIIIRKQNKFVWPLLMVYIFTVIYVTFLMRSPYQNARVSLTLFKEWKRTFIVKGEFVFLLRRLRRLRQSFLNMILFVPMGYFLPMVTNRMRSWWKVILFGLGVSLGIELLQYMTLLGMFDVDDLFNNTIGVGIGWIIWKTFFRERAEKRLRPNCRRLWWNTWGKKLASDRCPK